MSDYKIKTVGQEVCLFKNDKIIYSENVLAEDYAYDMVRRKRQELINSEVKDA